nr:trypsin epsilon-like [Drosophila suzukii]
MITKFLIIVSFAALVISSRIPEPELRIVGGGVVPIEKAPYQVAILWYGIQTCGGVIYSERIVLTAARCIEPTELDNYSEAYIAESPICQEFMEVWSISEIGSLPRLGALSVKKVRKV